MHQEVLSIWTANFRGIGKQSILFCCTITCLKRPPFPEAEMKPHLLQSIFITKSIKVPSLQMKSRCSSRMIRLTCKHKMLPAVQFHVCIASLKMTVYRSFNQQFELVSSSDNVSSEKTSVTRLACTKDQ